MEREIVPGFKRALQGYLRNVRRAHSEPSKAFRFLSFVRDTFKDVNADYAEELWPELEKYVRHKHGTVLVKGYIDALLGNLIIEFESDLDKKLEEAISQLKRYVAVLWSNETKHRVSYIAVASDGVRFVVYRPRTDVPVGEPVDEDQISLDELDRANLAKIDPNYAYLWLDRYFLARKLILPKAEEFAQHFGTKGPVFAVALRELEEAYEKAKSVPHVQVLYQEWAKYLSIVYGTAIESKELFLKHTYLALLAKLMVYSSYTGGALASPEALEKVLDGTTFKEWGIENFLEEDFFSWIARPPVRDRGLTLAHKLASELARYDLTNSMRTCSRSFTKSLWIPRTGTTLANTTRLIGLLSTDLFK